MPNLQRFMSDVGRHGFQKSNWFDFRITSWGYLGTGKGESVTYSNSTSQSVATFRSGVVEESFSDYQLMLEQGLVCTSVSLPGRGFATADQSIYGFTRKVPYYSEFPSLTCTFVVPTGIKGTNIGMTFFQQWMNRIQNTRQKTTSQSTVDIETGAFDMSFPDTYCAEAEICQYSFIDVSQTDTTAEINIRPDFLNASSTIGRAARTFESAYLKKDAPSNPNAGNTVRQMSLRHRFYQLYPASVEATPMSWADTDSFTQLTVSFNYSYWVDMGLSPEVEDSILSSSRGKDGSPSKVEQFFGTLKDAALDEARFRGWIK